MRHTGFPLGRTPDPPRKTGADQRSHPGRQDAWNAHGENAFGFEILERLKADDLGAGRDRRLKERLLQWTEELQATRI